MTAQDDLLRSFQIWPAPVQVHLAVRDDRGHLTGRVDAVEVRDDDVLVRMFAPMGEVDFEGEPFGYTAIDAQRFIRVGQLRVPILDQREHVGNIVYDAVGMAPGKALVLCLLLLGRGYTIEEIAEPGS